MFSQKLRKLGAAFGLRHCLWEHLRETLSETAWREENAPFLPQVSLESVIGRVSQVQLVSPHFQGGNVSPDELMVIAALVAHRKPRLSLEIGTFDGNSTLQIAANSADDGKVLTLDLPLDDVMIPDKVASADGQFIQSAERRNRRYASTKWSGSIKELFGDSMTFDFRGAIGQSRLDLAFIDGSHSYDYVKSDTERVLPLLRDDAVVIWHDYCRAWPGVVKYLNELGKSLPLRHVVGTSVVYLDPRRHVELI